MPAVPLLKSSEKLTFSQRHPILVQIGRDAAQLTWQQMGVPVLGTLGGLAVAMINDYLAGKLDLRAAIWNFILSLVIGIGLYILVAIIRAPFVVIGQQNRELAQMDRRLVEIEQKPTTIMPPASLLPLADVQPQIKTKTVTLEPNLQYLDAQVVGAHKQDDGVIVEGEIIERPYLSMLGDTKNLGAFVLPIQNRIPERKNVEIGTIANVSARLKYRQFESDKLAEVNRGAWLSEEKHRVYFGLGDTHKLIILTFEGSDNDPEIYAVSRDSVGTRKGMETHRQRLTAQGVFSLAIELIDESVGNVIKTWPFILEVEWKPEFKLALTRAWSWKAEHLHRFTSQGFDFSKRIHEIAIEASKLWPPSEPDQYGLSSLRFNLALPQQSKPKMDYFEISAQVLEAEQTEEEKLLDSIKAWEARAAEFVRVYVNADKADDFLKTEPSIDEGFKRTKRSSRSRFRITPRNAPPPPPVPEEWKLSDAVSSRIDKLIKIREQLPM